MEICEECNHLVSLEKIGYSLHADDCSLGETREGETMKQFSFQIEETVDTTISDLILIEAETEQKAKEIIYERYHNLGDYENKRRITTNETIKFITVSHQEI